MKKRVRFLTLLLAFIFLLTNVNSVFAADCDFDGDITEEEGAPPYVESEEVRAIRLARMANIRIRPITETPEILELPITPYLQEKDWYCGPATVKQVLQYLTGTSLTQDEYAALLGTIENEGTIMANIPKVLNDVLGDNYYILTKFSDLPYDSYWYLVIEESVYHRKPAILDINTYGIDSFPYKTTGHFVNLSGYDYSPGDGNPDQFRITDPFSKGFGNRWYNKGDLYQANYNHSNKAFIW